LRQYQFKTLETSKIPNSVLRRLNLSLANGLVKKSAKLLIYFNKLNFTISIAHMITNKVMTNLNVFSPKVQRKIFG